MLLNQFIIKKKLKKFCIKKWYAYISIYYHKKMDNI